MTTPETLPDRIWVHKIWPEASWSEASLAADAQRHPHVECYEYVRADLVKAIAQATPLDFGDATHLADTRPAPAVEGLLEAAKRVVEKGAMGESMYEALRSLRAAIAAYEGEKRDG